VAREAGAELVSGSSLKAALDLEWDNPEARAQALTQVLAALENVEQWLDRHPELIPRIAWRRRDTSGLRM
jgi:hypothetical protein